MQSLPSQIPFRIVFFSHGSLCVFGFLPEFFVCVWLFVSITNSCADTFSTQILTILIWKMYRSPWIRSELSGKNRFLAAYQPVLNCTWWFHHFCDLFLLASVLYLCLFACISANSPKRWGIHSEQRSLPQACQGLHRTITLVFFSRELPSNFAARRSLQSPAGHPPTRHTETTPKTLPKRNGLENNLRFRQRTASTDRHRTSRASRDTATEKEEKHFQN